MVQSSKLHPGIRMRTFKQEGKTHLVYELILTMWSENIQLLPLIRHYIIISNIYDFIESGLIMLFIRTEYSMKPFIEHYSKTLQV